MRYHVRRGDQEYGPYTLDELQRYTAQGNIIGSDLARGEGSQEWVRVDQLIGAAAGAVSPAPTPTYGAVPAYGHAFAGQPVPQGLHWAIVLLLSIVTCGLFGMIWMFVEAVYASRLGPNCRAPLFYGLYIGLSIAAQALAVASGDHSMLPIAALLLVAAIVFVIAGHYSIKDALEKHLGLRLSGVMVFFFNVLYFQYHLSAVRERMLGPRA